MSRKKWRHDGGHGGKDPGKVVTGVQEKTYTLEASMYVAKRMNEHGVDSDTTRTSDVTLTNFDRTSKMKGAVKGISHHFNGGGGNGVEVIHSIYADGEFEKLIIDEFKKAGYPVRQRPIYTKTLSSNPSQDFYFMHRDTGSCRVTIVEYDFLDGANIEKLKDKKYREGMYECVVRAICREEKITYKPVKNSVTSTSTKMYRVITGSFKAKSNADKRVKDLKSLGYDSFIEIYDLKK